MNDVIKTGFVALVLATMLGDPVVGAQGTGAAKVGVKQPSTPAALTATTPDEVRREAKQMFGFVPQLVQAAPDALLVGFWSGLKGLQMNPDTALDMKTKELIGLAVAAQIPCEYCVYFHTEAARKNGATDAQIKEAIGMASLTRMGSTILNGSQLDMAMFRKESDRMLKGDQKSSTQARSGAKPVR